MIPVVILKCSCIVFPIAKQQGFYRPHYNVLPDIYKVG